MTTIKPYDESTAEDFRRLFVERFPGGDVALLDTFLSNPARRDHPATGSIAYDGDGSVKAILGIVPRLAYLDQRPMRMANGVAISVRKDANRDFFSDFIRDSIMAQGADLYFVNTAIPPSRKRTANALPGLADGPDSCAEIRERTLRPRLWGWWKRKDGVVVEDEVDDTFDAFWKAYLATSVGLVSSRTAAELRWMFGKGLRTGETVLLTVRRGRELQGYAFCRRTDETATCWRVVDWIALGNDAAILEALIEGTADFLRRRTRAKCLQITGYPMWVQPLLKRLFPRSVAFGFNKCIWAGLSDRAKSLLGGWVNALNGWYGCPYDGDMCLM